MSILEEMISKHGGEDEAYRTKLKGHIREAFGYSSYMNKANAAAGKPLALNLKGDITPTGVKSLVGGAMGMRQRETEAYGGMAGAIGTQAESLATAQIAREKAARTKAGTRTGYENEVLFRPTDELDIELLDNVQTPINQDEFGKTVSVKSLQQIESELNAKLGDKYTPEQIKQRISDRLPKDYILNQGKYERMFRGFSEKEAQKQSDFIRYGTMSNPEKIIFKTNHPELGQDLANYENVVKALTEAHETEVIENSKTGERIITPKYSFSELVKNNPSVKEVDLKERVKPYYEDDVKRNVIDGILNEKMLNLKQFRSKWVAGDKYTTPLDMLKKVYKGEDTSDKFKMGGFVAVEKSDAYIKIKTQIEGDYGDIFQPAEIKRMLFQYLTDKLERNE